MSKKSFCLSVTINLFSMKLVSITIWKDVFVSISMKQTKITTEKCHIYQPVTLKPFKGQVFLVFLVQAVHGLSVIWEKGKRALDWLRKGQIKPEKRAKL